MMPPHKWSRGISCHGWLRSQTAVQLARFGNLTAHRLECVATLPFAGIYFSIPGLNSDTIMVDRGIYCHIMCYKMTSAAPLEGP